MLDKIDACHSIVEDGTKCGYYVRVCDYFLHRNDTTDRIVDVLNECNFGAKKKSKARMMIGTIRKLFKQKMS